MIFVNSMSDLFHEEVPLPYIRRVFKTMREPSGRDPLQLVTGAAIARFLYDPLRGKRRNRQPILGMEVFAVRTASKAPPPATEPVVDLDDVRVLRPSVTNSASNDVLETKQQCAVVVGMKL